MNKKLKDIEVKEPFVIICDGKTILEVYSNDLKENITFKDWNMLCERQVVDVRNVMELMVIKII